MTSKLSAQELFEIKDAFLKLDLNGNGKISKPELRKAISKKRPDEEVNLIMRLMDVDSNETIDLQEYTKMIAIVDYHKKPENEHFRQMFRSLDKNKDGYISPEEVRCLWNIFANNIDVPSLDKVDDIMAKMDSNKDGKIVYEEFLKHIN